MTVEVIENVQALDAALSRARAERKVAVLNFWAKWAEPCAHMNSVFEELSKTVSGALFLSIEAENVIEAAEHYEVESVPLFVLVYGKAVVARVEGADANALTLTVKDTVSKMAKQAARTEPPKRDAEAVNERLRQLVRSAKCVAFIKGTPAAPRCGFTRQLLELFARNNVDFSTFNILEDEEVRQGLKTLFNWPTYPQVYVDGELIGGLDVCKELEAAGELTATLPTRDPNAPVAQSLDDRLKALINQKPVMVFMKGTPTEPQCGFSRKLIGLLAPYNVEYGHFNILTDNEVREGLKKYSNWPTYPQVYVKGELIGGLDILQELHDAGELASTLTA